MYRITGDSFTVFGDAVGDDAGNFEVAHADVPASGADHSIQMVCSVACHCIAVVLPSASPLMIMTAQVGTNFDSELGSADIVLVNFYAPWYTPSPPRCSPLIICTVIPC